jgi:hypothetical protein
MRIVHEDGVSAEKIRTAMLDLLRAPRPVVAEARGRVATADPGIRVAPSLPVGRLLVAARPALLTAGEWRSRSTTSWSR